MIGHTITVERGVAERAAAFRARAEYDALVA